jgi:hypothetical protein
MAQQQPFFFYFTDDYFNWFPFFSFEGFIVFKFYDYESFLASAMKIYFTF